jgi:hypothetical protein
MRGDRISESASCCLGEHIIRYTFCLSTYNNKRGSGYFTVTSHMRNGGNALRFDQKDSGTVLEVGHLVFVGDVFDQNNLLPGTALLLL